MKKLLFLLMLTGCSKITQQDVINGKIEVCNDLVSMLLPEELNRSCRYNEEHKRLEIVLIHMPTKQVVIYDAKTGDKLN